MAEIIFHLKNVIYPHAPGREKAEPESVREAKGRAFSKLVTCKDL